MFAPPIKATKPGATSQAVTNVAPGARRHRSRPRAAISNQALLRLALLPIVQTKLRIGAVNDPLEVAADRVADEVMRMPDAAVGISRSAPDQGTARHLCTETDGEPQHKSDTSAGSVGEPAVAAQSAISSLAGGVPLSASERAYFEPRFRKDFSTVRLHDDAAAGAAARSINARAFTLGGNIAFAPGEYSPGTEEGRRLLAHELTHVVQQEKTPSASTVRRKAHPGCDKRTTGIEDADARIDRARVEALRIMAVATAALPRLNTRTTRLVDRHFHCPSSSQIVAITASLAAIETKIPSDVRCVGAGIKERSLLTTGRISSDGVLELFPYSFQEEFKKEDAGIAGAFVWAAALNAGLDNDTHCDRTSACYNDFTVPASDMMKHAETYRNFAVDLAGYAFRQPSTIPCPVQSLETYVFVPPGALSDPKLIRPVTGYESAPPGSVVLTVHEDRAGHKFIYHNDLPGAEVFMPDEPKRYYFDRSVWAVPTEADILKLQQEEKPSEKKKR